MRSLKNPLQMQSTREPFHARFVIAISMAADPGPATPITHFDSVWNTYRAMVLTWPITAAMVEPRWLITTPLARATASGIGTGPAPIISRGSSGRMEESGRTVGHAMLNVSGVPDSAEKVCRSFIGARLKKAILGGSSGWLSRDPLTLP